MTDPRTASLLRKANGIVSLCLLAALSVHAVVNCLRFGGLHMPSLALLAWASVAATVLHVGLCVATSNAMLTDTERPPSQKKRRHLVIKWITGGLVLAVAGVHIAASQGVLGTAAQSGRWLLVGLVVALAIHLWTGARSFLSDLGLPRSWKPAVRALVVLGACALAAAVLLT